MHKLQIILLATTLTGFVSPSISHSEDSGYFFDCDVPPSRVSMWHGAIDSTAGLEISGTIQVLDVRHDERWLPVGSVFLLNSEQRKVGLQFFFNWKEPHMLQVALYAGDRKTFASLPMPDSPIPFVLSVTASGDMTATVDNKSETVRLDAFDARRIELSCSSGEFKFEGVLVTSD